MTQDTPPTTDLMLRNRLDSAATVEASSVGPDGSFLSGSFVPGMFGGAWQAGSGDLRGISFPSSVINPEHGTIEFWARISGVTGTIPTGDRPLFFQTEPLHLDLTQPWSDWRLGLNGNDGAGNGGLTGAVGDGNTTGTGVFGNSYSYAGVLGDPGAWHHYALVWDAAGLPELGLPDRQVAVLLDGQVASGHWEPNVLRGFGPDGPVFTTGELTAPNGDRLVLLPLAGPDWPDQASVTLDNLKVWDVARADFSDRFQEAGGPPEPMTWEALAAQVEANFAATGQWFITPGTPMPPPPTVDWNALAAEAEANFAATGHWFLTPETPPPVSETTTWDEVAAQVEANFAATGQWFVTPGTPVPAPETVDWDALAAQAEANFAATGQWYL